MDGSYFAAAQRNQQLFAAAGIPFDPRWLVLAPRTLDVPPPIEYVAWMHWVQEQVKPWMRRATDVIHEHGARTWLYWGDAHVGIEPYMGSIEAGNVDQIDKPAADPVTARALVDFPGDAYRRLRVDWLHTHLVGQAGASENLRLKWGRTRRDCSCARAGALLDADAQRHRPRRRLYPRGRRQFGPRSTMSSASSPGSSGVARVEGALNLRRPLMGRQSGGRGMTALRHLTDLRARASINFREVIDGGVPEDAHCLFLYGLPGTAWSGGRVWRTSGSRT